MIGNQFGGLKRDPAKMLVDLLKRAKDQFLRFLMILIGKVRKHLSDDLEINLAVDMGMSFRIRHVASLPGYGAQSTPK